MQNIENATYWLECRGAPALPGADVWLRATEKGAAIEEARTLAGKALWKCGYTRFRIYYGMVLVGTVRVERRDPLVTVDALWGELQNATANS